MQRFSELSSFAMWGSQDEWCQLSRFVWTNTRGAHVPTVSRMPSTLTLRSTEQLLPIQQHIRLFLPVAWPSQWRVPGWTVGDWWNITVDGITWHAWCKRTWTSSRPSRSCIFWVVALCPWRASPEINILLLYYFECIRLSAGEVVLLTWILWNRDQWLRRPSPRCNAHTSHTSHLARSKQNNLAGLARFANDLRQKLGGGDPWSDEIPLQLAGGVPKSTQRECSPWRVGAWHTQSKTYMQTMGLFHFGGYFGGNWSLVLAVFLLLFLLCFCCFCCFLFLLPKFNRPGPQSTHPIPTTTAEKKSATTKYCI